MSWKCPACLTEIRHEHDLPAPRPTQIYRCPVCHLELVFDAAENRLVLAPLTEPT